MKKIFAGAIVIAIVSGAGYWGYTQWFGGGGTQEFGALTKDYSNSTHNFSLKMPASFEASEIPDRLSGGEVIVLQNQAGEGIQIAISPFDEDGGGGYTLTRERILQDLPDMKIDNEQPVEVSDDYTGIAFLTDDPSFGPSSRAVWFVYRGNLYQINAYATYDELLKEIFSTWQFTQ